MPTLFNILVKILNINIDKPSFNKDSHSSNICKKLDIFNFSNIVTIVTGSVALKITPITKEYSRLSLVCYLREKMIRCKDL